MSALILSRSTGDTDGRFTSAAHRRAILRVAKLPDYRVVQIPTEFVTLETTPSMDSFQRRIYVAGMFNQIAAFTEDEQFYPAGMRAPSTKPLLSKDASGGVTLIGKHVGAVSYVQKIEQVDVVESNLSPSSNELDYGLGGTEKIKWLLPSEKPPKHATHIRGYRDVDGSLPFRAFEVPVGTATWIENIPVASLVEHDAYFNDGNNPTFDQLVPPYGRFLAVYRHRLFVAGDPAHPDRLWFSELNRPGNFGELSFFETDDGEPITGMGVVGERLVVFSFRTIYECQGYTDGSEGLRPDMEFRKMIDGIGCVSHYSILNINNRLWWASEDGVRIFSGSWDYVTKDLRSFWRDDYKANPQAYQESVAADDRVYHNYILLVPQTAGSFYYVAGYEYNDPALGGTGQQPAWAFDTRARIDTTIANLTDENGFKAVYYGSADGFVRKVDDSNADDDGDTSFGAPLIVTRHEYLGQQAGDKMAGKNVKALWSYVEAEDDTWRVQLFGGDESAFDQETAPWTDNVSPPPATFTQEGKTHTPVAKGVHNHRAVFGSGRGVTLAYTAPLGASVDWIWRGFGLTFGPGVSVRGPATTLP